MRINIIFLVLILNINIIIIVGNKSALCFLTTRPKVEMIKFAEELGIDGEKYNMKVYIMIDDNSYIIPKEKSLYIEMLHISNSKCKLNGYEQTMYVETRPIVIGTWDRAFLYFCKLNKNYSFVWFIEDDVFIPHIDTFRSIHQLYSYKNDLIVQRPIPNWIGDISTWAHWSLAKNKLILPWYKSMTNAMGLSRRLLDSIDNYIQWRGISLLHEILPQTLSIHLNMTIVSPIELNTLFWEDRITWEDIEDVPNNLWHPVKNWTLQKQWHQKIVNENKYLNNNIQWFNLSFICYQENNSTYLEEYISQLVFYFNQNKIYLSSNKRRLIRQHFLNLSKQCQNLNDFKLAKTIVEELADNAYKLPDNNIPLIRKNLNYFKIEKLIKKNKENIFKFYKNLTILNELREQASNLTQQLSFEIQQDLKEQFEKLSQEQIYLIQNRSNYFQNLNIFSSNGNFSHSLFVLYHLKTSLYNHSQIEYFLFILFILSLFILSYFYRLQIYK